MVKKCNKQLNMNGCLSFAIDVRSLVTTVVEQKDSTPPAVEVPTLVVVQNAKEKGVDPIPIDKLVTEKWTEVSNSKDRGKRIMVEETADSVLSTNGLDALGILNDLLELQNLG